VVVVGATDVGKSTFIRAAVTAATQAGSPLPLIDLDPGQKMIGPPGTAALGWGAEIEQLVFIGSTSASEVSKIIGAASLLAHASADRFIANTAGFVRGLGARLQSATIAALQPDLIVAIGEQDRLRPILDAHRDIAVALLERPLSASRKSAAQRARLRQAAFAAALEGAEVIMLRTPELSFNPAPPVSFTDAARPICALARADGKVIGIGVLQEVGEEAVVFTACGPRSATAEVQLGKMWASPSPAGWQLLEKLTPSWQYPALPEPPSLTRE
jgi:polynucleotide 5'-kinase involved in rRNA processing